MVRRRRLLAATAGLALTAGCLGGETADGTPEAPTTATPRRETADEEDSLYLVGAPVGDDGREPVLSTQDRQVSAVGPLVDLTERVVDQWDVDSVELTEAEAETFRSLVEDVEYYPAGNPPGYYVEHDGRTVSVDPKEA
jgi:hypothetical protein